MSDIIYDLIFDPGHGGADPGAIGPTTKEKDNVLTLAKKTATHLEATGRFRVKFTRDTDKDFCNGFSHEENMDLRNRVKVANDLGGKAFFSFHNNSAASKAYGNEVYAAAPGGEGEKLAKAICTRMVTLGMADRGVKFKSWYVCKWTDMSAVLIEYGFINSEEAAILAKMDQAALAIAQGIEDYFGVSVAAATEEGAYIVDKAILMFSDEDYWAAKDVSSKKGGIAMFVRQGATRTVPGDALKVKHLITIGGAATGHANETLLSGKTKFDTVAAVAKYLS